MTTNQLTYWANQEVKRHNLATESETNRANVAKETETHRTNVANESLKGQQIAETRRHNVATESLDINALAEQTRYNKARNAIDAQLAMSKLMSDKVNRELMTAQAAETRSRKVKNYVNIGTDVINTINPLPD